MRVEKWQRYFSTRTHTPTSAVKVVVALPPTAYRQMFSAEITPTFINNIVRTHMRSFSHIKEEEETRANYVALGLRGTLVAVERTLWKVDASCWGMRKSLRWFQIKSKWSRTFEPHHCWLERNRDRESLTKKTFCAAKKHHVGNACLRRRKCWCSESQARKSWIIRLV